MKYLYFAAGLALLVLLLAAKSLYSDNQQLKEDKTKLEQSLTDAQNKNASLNKTISKQIETQQSIDDTKQAIREMHEQISTELQQTKYSIKNQIKVKVCTFLVIWFIFKNCIFYFISFYRNTTALQNCKKITFILFLFKKFLKKIDTHNLRRIQM